MESATLDAPVDTTDDQETRLDQFNALDEFGIYRGNGTAFGDQLRKETIGVRISVRKFFARKSLTRDQVGTAANQFSADAKMLSASKSLLNTRDPAYKAVAATINRARHFWWSLTVDYPVTGIRLIRKALVETFDEEMKQIKAELDQNVEALEAKYAELRTEAVKRLGTLYNESDYPESMALQFSLVWDFPSVEPPDDLKKLNPALYEAEKARIAARFDEAVSMAEESFTSELSKLVSHLTEQLTGHDEETGKPKVFRASAVENLKSFFDRFQTLSIHSNPELDALVEAAKRTVERVDPTALRKDEAARKSISGSMAEVAARLDSMMVNRPTRAISLEDE